MLLINTGNGKGKTSASIGITIRALGQDMTVAFGQFMKRDEQAGEQRMLKKLLGDNFFAQGEGFLTKEEDRPLHRAAAEKTIHWAHTIIPQVDMLVLDETLYAYKYELVTEAEIRSLIALAREHETHLILSGRDCPEWLVEEADCVTEMGEIKHHYASGIAAQKGIEF